MSKEIKSLNYLVCISKLLHQIIANFVLKFPGRKSSKAQKKIYISRLQEGIEYHSAFTISITSNVTNFYRLIRKYLKSHLPSNYRQGLETQPCPNQR